MSTDKPSHNEDEYFAKRDAELITQQRLEQQKAAMKAERRTHFMKCPKCGADLTTTDFHGVQIERCPDCAGVWLDQGELDILAGNKDPGLLGRVFGDLFTSLKKK